MSNSDAAEQVVRMSLEGGEVAVKVTGAAVKNIAVLLYSALKAESRTRGRARLGTMLRSGKELKVFTVRGKDLRKFTEDARRYGVLYCVLAKKNLRSEDEVDILVRAEDAAKINRIVEKHKLVTVESAQVKTEEQVESKSEKEKLLDELLEKKDNPLEAKRERSPSEVLLEPNVKDEKGFTDKKERKSVKKQLQNIQARRKNVRKMPQKIPAKSRKGKGKKR